MKKKITVAVDGPAGSGKSSVCKSLASEMSMKYIDSGAIYRAVTWYFLAKGDLNNATAFPLWLSDLKIEQTFLKNGVCRTFVNGIDVSLAIRDEAVIQNIGAVSDSLVVRNFVNALLRKWAAEESVIMDGRDIGTVVFPDADIKIYLDASVDIRAKRRAGEYAELGKNVDENTIKKQIIQRDEQDRSRSYGALRMAEDAMYCDTSFMNQSQVVEYLKKFIEKTENDELTVSK